MSNNFGIISWKKNLFFFLNCERNVLIRMLSWWTAYEGTYHLSRTVSIPFRNWIFPLGLNAWLRKKIGCVDAPSKLSEFVYTVLWYL